MRARSTAVLLGLVLLGDLLALRVLAPPAPSGVADAVREFRLAVPARSPSPPAAVAAAPTAVPTRASRELPPEAPATRASAVASPRPVSRPGARSAPVLEPGVYSYATSGYEQVRLLGVDRHDYPATTAITVRSTSCGTTSTWQPVEGRVERREVCRTPAGSALREVTSLHRFLQVDDARSFRCPSTAVVVAETPVVGTRMTGTCDGEDGDTLTFTVEVVATGLREPVGAESVPVTRLQVTGLLAGSESGRHTEERWVTASGLLVRSRTITEGAKETPLGTARYTEDVELRLTSLRPRR